MAQEILWSDCDISTHAICDNPRQYLGRVQQQRATRERRGTPESCCLYRSNSADRRSLANRHAP